MKILKIIWLAIERVFILAIERILINAWEGFAEYVEYKEREKEKDTEPLK